jgi:hypothetical protein
MFFQISTAFFYKFSYLWHLYFSYVSYGLKRCIPKFLWSTFLWIRNFSHQFRLPMIHYHMIMLI